jgi:hypothetical protein
MTGAFLPSSQARSKYAQGQTASRSCVIPWLNGTARAKEAVRGWAFRRFSSFPHAFYMKMKSGIYKINHLRMLVYIIFRDNQPIFILSFDPLGSTRLAGMTISALWPNRKWKRCFWTLP